MQSENVAMTDLAKINKALEVKRQSEDVELKHISWVRKVDLDTPTYTKTEEVNRKKQIPSQSLG